MNDDKIKALIAYGFALEALIKQVLGGLNLLAIPQELISAVGLITSAGATLADAPAALQQYLALTDAAAADIDSFVVANYGATPDSVDSVVEKVLNFLVSLHSVAAWVASKV